MFEKKSYSSRIEKNNKCNQIKSINALTSGIFYIKTKTLSLQENRFSLLEI